MTNSKRHPDEGGTRSAAVDVLILLEWLDGPLEGILRFSGEALCWHFKLFAERRETTVPDDRVFGLWPIEETDSAVLIEEFGDVGEGMHVWPVEGGLGSSDARRIVGQLLNPQPGLPSRLIRTGDFREPPDAWDVVGGR